jgi:hypothetical protein
MAPNPDGRVAYLTRDGRSQFFNIKRDITLEVALEAISHVIEIAGIV